MGFLIYSAELVLDLLAQLSREWVVRRGAAGACLAGDDVQGVEVDPFMFRAGQHRPGQRRVRVIHGGLQDSVWHASGADHLVSASPGHEEPHGLVAIGAIADLSCVRQHCFQTRDGLAARDDAQAQAGLDVGHEPL